MPLEPTPEDALGAARTENVAFEVWVGDAEQVAGGLCAEQVAGGLFDAAPEAVPYVVGLFLGAVDGYVVGQPQCSALLPFLFGGTSEFGLYHIMGKLNSRRSALSALADKRSDELRQVHEDRR